MNPLNLFRKPRSASTAPQAHMTFARTSAGRTIMRTGAILKEQVWLWPIIAVVVLAVVGVSVSSAIRSTMKSSFQSQLQTLLNVETAMLETWLKTQGAGAETQPNEPIQKTPASVPTETVNYSSAKAAAVTPAQGTNLAGMSDMDRTVAGVDATFDVAENVRTAIGKPAPRE